MRAFILGLLKVRIPLYKWVKIKNSPLRSPWVRPIYYGDDYVVMESLSVGWYFSDYITLHKYYEVANETTILA